MHRKLIVVALLLFLPVVFANSYVADMNIVASQVYYTTNESIELKGTLYLSNYSNNGTLLSNHTALANTTIVLSIVSKATNQTNASYSLNTSSTGEFYSRSNYYTTATLITAPLAAGYYYIRANYSDPNGTNWWTQTEIQVVNQTVDKLIVSTDKLTYDSSSALIITSEAVKEIGDRITYVANVTINGTIRNSTKSILSSFNCTTDASGKCTSATTAPSSYGNYIIEINNFKGYSSFEVIRFAVNIEMKDNLGESIKHIFNTADDASVEVTAITNSTSEEYTFTGTIRTISGSLITSINSTVLNYTNSYKNRFTFTLDAINFPAGSYLVDVNVTKTGDGTVATSTSFEIKSWSVLVKKRDIGSGFDYEYSTFSNSTLTLQIFPIYRQNGSVIDTINTTTSLNISLIDSMNNILNTTNSTWNATCGKEGCYEFSLIAPSSTGSYIISVSIEFGGYTQTTTKRIAIISSSASAQSTDKDGTLKELFGAKEYAYISLSAKNSTVSVNLSNASIFSVVYMNGTEYSYVQVDSPDLVNASNANLEWAWNNSAQKLKLETPGVGGLYIVYITADNNTVAANAKFIVNPYEICLVAKNTAGQVSSGYYYVNQFKTSDTIYFEIKIYQANNPTGRASFLNATNSSYGRGSACYDYSTTKQVVNNATITIAEVSNIETGKSFALNTTSSICKSDDNKGSYTCTAQPIGSWDGGNYAVKFKLVSQDGQTTDIDYGGFQARAFYLYAWSSNWRNSPTSTISLNIYMYEAGNNWWGNYGSGGLTGTVSLQKIEYQGSTGEWLSTPIDYNYNISQINTSTVTNGQGSMSLSGNYSTINQQWKTGSYRAILKGTDSAGTSDYGYAWFEVRQWEVYASPVECTSSSCTSVYNINSRSNISLYLTINNAGQWGQSGQSLGGNVTIRVKKIQDCRKWPCTDLNSSSFNSTSITVNKSSGWYWGTPNTSYLINITPTSGTWGTGYWQVVFDVNGTETGTGWFNTISFYVETQTTDSTGINWKSTIKNNESLYLKATTVRSQKNGNYYSSYNGTDYINTTIHSANLRKWDSVTQQNIEYKYPTDFNISFPGGGSTINGSRVLNITYNSGNWPSGYFSGELILKNVENNETAQGWIWFQVKQFRVQTTVWNYTIDDDICINASLVIYNPDWNDNTRLTGTYNITNAKEDIWSAYGRNTFTYTNFTPSSFNGSVNITICPNDNRWPSGGWGGYHYIPLRISDSNNNTDEGWLSFRTLPFTISWGSIVGGTNIYKSGNVVVPVTLTRSGSGISTSGNLTKIYQWRYDNFNSRREEYNFSVGSCNTSSGSASCMVNGTMNVTIIAPTDAWKDGYNYLQAEWSAYDNQSTVVQDWSGIWFNAQDYYNGWWDNANENGTWQYYYGLDQNLTIRLYVRDSNAAVVTVNVTNIEYSAQSATCVDEYCRVYASANYSIVGQTNTSLTNSAIIKLAKPSVNWTRGTYSIRATIRGANGTIVIKGGYVVVKDMSAPVVTVTIPLINSTITASTTESFWINWTTSKASRCNLYIYSYDYFYLWHNCASQNSTNSSVSSLAESCNTTKYGFNGTTGHQEFIYESTRYWTTLTTWGYISDTGLNTGATSHYYHYNLSASGRNLLANQSYGIVLYCYDTDWNTGIGYAAFRLNTTTNTTINVSLVSPANNDTYRSSNVSLNYSWSGPTRVNCSLYGNFSGSWSLNQTVVNQTSIAVSSYNITLVNGTYLWNVYCVEYTNSSNYAWGIANRTVIVNTTNTTMNVSLVSPANSSSLNASSILLNYSWSGPSRANCSLYGNNTGTWLLNQTSSNLTTASNNFNVSWRNGTYLWNVYCIEYTNTSNFAWAANYTFRNNYTG